MESNVVGYTEKQYLGRDYVRISIRLVMILFCLIAYFITEERERDTAHVFLFVGFAILVVSIVMMFLPHYSIRVRNKSVILDGLWTSRLVKIDLNSIAKIEQVCYGAHLIINPVYNLHKNGTIRFYAGGKFALELTDRDGLIYMIGTQFPADLARTIATEMAI